MNIGNNYITLQSDLNHHHMNFNHSHILCPFNFCSCICCICNYCFNCQCICHQLKNKTTRNIIDTNNINSINNIATKTPLSNYSNNLYYKDKSQFKNDIYNISPENINPEYLTKKLFQDKLNIKSDNKNIKNYGHSRSLSEISMRNTKKNNEYLNINNKKKYFSRSYMNDFYNNNNLYKRAYYNPSTERENLLTKNRFNNNDNYISINGDKSEEKYLKRNESSFLNYDNFYKKTIELNNNNDIEDKNNKYLNNYHKKNKYRSYLNSAKKRDKIIDNLIKNRKRKDVYLNLEQNKNAVKSNNVHKMINKNKNYENKDFNEDNYFCDKNKISNNPINYKNEYEKNYSNNTSRTNNYKYLREIQNLNQKHNKNYKLNINSLNEDKNLYKNTNKYNNIKNKDDIDNNNNNYNYNLDKNDKIKNIISNSYNNNIKNNNLSICSFCFSIKCYNKKLDSTSVKDEINYIKNQLIKKDKEILEYKSKINLLTKELEFYKNEIKNYENDKKLNSIYNKKYSENHLVYRKKSKDEIKTNHNEYNKYQKEKDNLKNLIKNDNNLGINYINENINKDNNNKNNNNNNIIIKNKRKDKIIDLSSKLNINTDLNISKDKNYISSHFQNKNISDKCIFTISSLTKSKSILCFDYSNKVFSFRDYADFGEFQENYLLSFENNNEYLKNNSIFLVINYNFFIVTGENCDMLYVYNSLKRTMNKLCSLKNNHSNGNLINYSNDIICISGSYNKKVELYNQSKNQWINLPELQIERRNFTACILKNKYIFCLFGYNFPSRQYLNTIEYLDMENYKTSSWRYLNYKNEDLLSLYIINAIGINYNDEKIIIVGGNNGQENKPNEYFYQIIISENFEKDKESYVEKIKRKLKDINKNKCYLFNKGYNKFLDNNNLFYLAFDDYLRAHLFQVNNMAHDVFYFD